jgi:hypothetical protein
MIRDRLSRLLGEHAEQFGDRFAAVSDVAASEKRHTYKKGYVQIAPHLQ